LCGTALSCAAAGSTHAAVEAAVENTRNKTLRTAMPPHRFVRQYAQTLYATAVDPTFATRQGKATGLRGLSLAI